MPYKAILFDLDNTLVDFTAAEQSGLHTIHQIFFNDYISLQDLKSSYLTINKHLWQLLEQKQLNVQQLHSERFRLLAETLNVNLDTTAIATLYEQTLGLCSHWYPGIKETLLVLKQKYLLGIITNGLAQVKKIQNHKLEITQLCQSFLVSELLGIAKPEKEIFTLALQQLNATPTETLMVGDSLSSDYQGAINANLDFCWVNKTQQILPAELPTPKYIIKTVTELPAILANVKSSFVLNYQDNLQLIS